MAGAVESADVVHAPYGRQMDRTFPWLAPVCVAKRPEWSRITRPFSKGRTNEAIAAPSGKEGLDTRTRLGLVG